MNKKNPLNILLSVVDPSYQNTIILQDWIADKSLFDSTLNLAIKNGLFHLFFTNLNEKCKLVDSDILEKWSESSANVTKILETITLLEAVLPKHEIPYIIIKIFNTVPHSPNDVDIFIRNSDREKVLTILMENGMKSLHSSVAETKMVGNYSKTDIYTEISYLGIEFLDKDFLWSSRTENTFFEKPYPALNNEADLLMLFPHFLFGHGRITLLDFLHLKSRLNHTDMEFCRAYADKKGWLFTFDAMVDLIEKIDTEIDNDDGNIKFPFRFNHTFVKKCISETKGLKMSVKEKLFLGLSFAYEDVIYGLEDTGLYNFVKSISGLRNLINSISAFFKTMRGDKKSSN